LRNILQLCKANTPFEVEEREKKMKRKIIIGAPPCYGEDALAHKEWRDASDATVKG
jgi:hypothetical protein